MCVVSMIMDHYHDKWQPLVPQPLTIPVPVPNTFPPAVPLPTREEVAEFHQLLERARKYDREHGEPECELESKKETLRKIAEALGLELKLDAVIAAPTPGGAEAQE